MKIRQGFVSNSSSSSFVIMGIERDLDYIMNHEMKNKVIMFGEYLSDGMDVIELTPEIKEMIAQNSNRKDYFYDRTFLEVGFGYSSDCDNCPITKDEIIKAMDKLDGDKVQLLAIEKDYHSTDGDVEMLYQRYIYV